MSTFDFLVVGAGIAGASAAAELAREGSVALIEMEAQPGYHTTGRSAAVFAASYGPAPIRALSRASADFFHQPPEGFVETQLLASLPVLMLARQDQLSLLDTFIDTVSPETEIQSLDAKETEAIQPLIRAGYAAGSALDPSTYSVDVNGLHQGYLRAFKARGGTLICDAQLQTLTRKNRQWIAETPQSTFVAPTVVNAAGAWADQLGAMAGAEKIGLVPKRRTALIVDPPQGHDLENRPMVVDIAEEFYLKADAGKLLISPANEDPMDPCDVQPDEMDIAICIDRIERAFELRIKRIENKWAGLRSFVADKSPVVGFSRQAEGFFWLAAQGGYGIQTCPAMARLAACLATEKPVPQDILDAGFDPLSTAPDRPSIRT